MMSMHITVAVFFTALALILVKPKGINGPISHSLAQECYSELSSCSRWLQLTIGALSGTRQFR